jgi:hypothetical protein
MSNMIEMPRPPEPPVLPHEKIRELIAYADGMAAFMEAEAELINELGRTAPENDPAPIIQGWKFTALALRESYNGHI